MAKGRGRLSSIDLLSAEAADDVLWANQQLYIRERPISEIHAEFNARLAAKGIEQISRTAFYNRSLRIAAAQTRMRQSREMFAGLASEFTAEDVDESTAILGEFLKTLIIELTDDAAGVKKPKDALDLARAYQATVMGQKVSTDRRIKLQAEAKANAVAAMEKAIGQVAASGTVNGDEVLRKIREEVYGIFEKKTP